MKIYENHILSCLQRTPPHYITGISGHPPNAILLGNNRLNKEESWRLYNPLCKAGYFLEGNVAFPGVNVPYSPGELTWFTWKSPRNEEEHHLPSTFVIFVFHVGFPGCKFQISLAAPFFFCCFPPASRFWLSCPWYSMKPHPFIPRGWLVTSN